MTIWFTSDNHFGHANIIKFSNRPFANVQEMNEIMILNWNKVVQPGDTVYHLGDFSFLDEDATCKILDRLHGNKMLILGNHDKRIHSKTRHHFGFVKDYYELKVDDLDGRDGRQMIVLMHYSMRTWNKAHFGTWQLYGHSHNNLHDDPNLLSMDVGVDAHNFTPISYSEVKARMSHKKFVPIDHHGRE